MLGEHLSQKLTPITPKFGQKCDLGGQKSNQLSLFGYFRQKAD